MTGWDYYALFSAVFQDFSLLEASVAENVAQRVEGIDTGRVWQCLDQAGLSEAVRALPQGLDTRLGREVYEDGIELSGGQTQRLMLARALYKNGPILALDRAYRRPGPHCRGRHLSKIQSDDRRAHRPVYQSPAGIYPLL